MSIKVGIINLSVTSAPLTSVNIDAHTPGTAVLVGRAGFAVANFLLDDCRLLLDEVLALNRKRERDKFMISRSRALSENLIQFRHRKCEKNVFRLAEKSILASANLQGCQPRKAKVQGHRRCSNSKVESFSSVETWRKLLLRNPPRACSNESELIASGGSIELLFFVSRAASRCVIKIWAHDGWLDLCLLLSED